MHSIFPIAATKFLCRTFQFVLMAICLMDTGAIAQTPNQVGLPVSIHGDGKRLTVMLGDQEFTTFDFGAYNKPIFYPIYGPGQIGMTRNWPMNDEVPGEAHDHPHHKSMWISHEISGVDFWSERGRSFHSLYRDKVCRQSETDKRVSIDFILGQEERRKNSANRPNHLLVWR